MQAFIPQQDARGCIIPNFILHHQSLSNGAKMLFTVLGSYARAKSYCYPSLATLTKSLSCSHNTLKAWLNQLIEHGFVQTKSQEKRLYFYLFFPKKFNPQPSKIDSQVSKIDSKDNIKNFNNTIKTPYSPPSMKHEEKALSQKESRRGGGDYKQNNQDFEKLWEVYPRKEAKESARKIWFSLGRMGKLPSFEEMKSAIKAFYQTYAWQREQGRFIPQLVNFLKGLRWKDIEVSPRKQIPPTQITEAEAPIYQLRKQKECQNAVDRSKQDSAFFQFKSNFNPTNKIDECLATVLFDKLYHENKIPELLERQNIPLLAFLKRIQQEA